MDDFTRKTYLRFDLSQLSGADPQDARLKLTVANADCDEVTFNLFGLNDLNAGENWSETTLSWNTATGNNTAAQDGMNGSATLLGTFTLGAGQLGGVVSFASPGPVTFLQSDTNGRATLMLTRQGPPGASNTGSQDFAAKEHATLDAPLLDLTIVEAGGTYFAVEGGAVSLAGSGRTTNVGPYSYDGDLDGDSVFGETGVGATRGNETGATPTFQATGLDGPTSVTVTLRISDTSLGSATDTATINITNAAPSASIGGTLLVNEGSLLALTGNACDPGTGEVFTFAWDLDGDGVFGETGAGAARGAENLQNPSFNAARLNGPSLASVQLRVSDDDGGVSAVLSATVSILNVAPSELIATPVTVPEEGSVVLSVTAVSDPGTSDVLTYQWDLDGGAVFGETGDGYDDIAVGSRDAVGSKPTASSAFLEQQPSLRF